LSKELTSNQLLNDLAQKYNVKITQIMLNYGICRGCVVLPRSGKLDHQKENIDVFNFKLTDQEVKQLNKLDLQRRFIVYG